ncbi:MAG: AzlC family ABC transporter permease [Rhodoblastus sp.]
MAQIDVPPDSPQAAPPPGPAERRRLFVEGARQAIGGPAYLVAIALFGVGGLAKAAGFPPATAFLSTLLIWAGPAQVLFFGAIAAGTALPAVAVSISLSSIRLMPMVLSLLPMLRTPTTSRRTLFFATHFVAVTVWAESLRRLPEMEREKRLPFYFGFATACIGVTAIFTQAGYYMTAALPGPLAAGILFLTPIYFLSTLLRAARAPIDWFALIFGLTLAPVTQAWVGGGFDLLALGLVGGAGAYVCGRFVTARRAERAA